VLFALMSQHVIMVADSSSRFVFVHGLPSTLNVIGVGDVSGGRHVELTST
jgi:hypothetical protein